MSRIPLFRRSITAIAASVLAAACGRPGADVSESDGARLPPPAAALSAESGVAIETRLEGLERHLIAVLEGGLDEQSQASLLAAEAVTDRLLEEQVEAEWLNTGYLVEARLRQVQALADRIVAEMRRGVARELVLEDVASLRAAVQDLRRQLAASGNGEAPAAFDSLLLAYANDTEPARGGGAAASSSSDTADAEPTTPAEPTVVPEGGPLGDPIRP